jgi:hypothetical protein
MCAISLLARRLAFALRSWDARAARGRIVRYAEQSIVSLETSKQSTRANHWK